MNLAPTTRLRRIESQASSQLGEETVVVDYAAGLYFSLNGVGGWIWNYLGEAGTATVEAIEAGVLAAYDVDPARGRAETRHFLEALLRENLVETVL